MYLTITKALLTKTLAVHIPEVLAHLLYPDIIVRVGVPTTRLAPAKVTVPATVYAIQIVRARAIVPDAIRVTDTATEIVPVMDTATEIVPVMDTATEIVPVTDTATEIVPVTDTATENRLPCICQDVLQYH